MLTTFLWVEFHWGKIPSYLVSSVVLWGWGAASLTPVTIFSFYCHLAGATGACWLKLKDCGGVSSPRPSGSWTQSHNSITSTGLNLINCNHNHYSPSSTLLLCVHPRYNLFAHSHALHTLSHCTSYPLFYFIICFLLHSHHICIYIYTLSCFCFIVFLLLLCYFYFIIMFYFSFLHFPLSGPVLTNISLPIIPCMIVYVTNNKEPWTLPSVLLLFRMRTRKGTICFAQCRH